MCEHELWYAGKNYLKRVIMINFNCHITFFSQVVPRER